MIRIRNAFSRLIRVGRNRATAPDSLPPFIRIVKNQPCPYCGAIFPNRPKVHDGKGWWWRCYTEDCVVRYYQPEHMLVKLRCTGETISYEELWRRFRQGIIEEESELFEERLEKLMNEIRRTKLMIIFGFTLLITIQILLRWIRF